MFCVNVLCTCGMMVSLDLRSCRPISDIFTPSMRISPAAASSNLKRHSVMEDLPAPVRPTIPICTQTHTRRHDDGEATLLMIHLAYKRPHHSHLLSSFDVQCELLQDEVQTLPVPDAVVVEIHIPLHGPFRWGLLVLHFPGGLWTLTEHFCLGKLSEQLISLLGFQQSWFVYHCKSSEIWNSVCAESPRAAKHLFHITDTLDAPNKGFD